MKGRVRKAGTVAAAFVAGVAIGPLVGAWAQDSSRAETYRLLNLFGDVFERVRAEYVEPINDREAIENAINGMLTGLDPHSSYLNQRNYRDMQVQTRGEFGGLGIEVTQENGYIKVISPIDDTPAQRAGIKPGDLITHLNGKTVQGLSLQDAVEQMRGERGTSIKLTIRREGADRPPPVHAGPDPLGHGGVLFVGADHQRGGRPPRHSPTPGALHAPHRAAVDDQVGQARALEHLGPGLTGGLDQCGVEHRPTWTVERTDAVVNRELPLQHHGAGVEPDPRRRRGPGADQPVEHTPPVQQRDAG